MNTKPHSQPDGPQQPLDFEQFAAQARADGFDEVLVREWAASQQVGQHQHPFDVKAIVARGELWLSCGAQARHLPAGSSFELARNRPHDELYGSAGATLWVARRNPKPD